VQGDGLRDDPCSPHLLVLESRSYGRFRIAAIGRPFLGRGHWQGCFARRAAVRQFAEIEGLSFADGERKVERGLAAAAEGGIERT